MSTVVTRPSLISSVSKVLISQKKEHTELSPEYSKVSLFGLYQDERARLEVGRKQLSSRLGTSVLG